MGSKPGIGCASKSCIRWLPVTQLVSMVNVKEDDVFLEEVIHNGAELRFAVYKAYGTLKLAEISVYLVYNFALLGLLEAVEQCSEDKFE